MLSASPSLEQSRLAALPFLTTQGFPAEVQFSVLRGGANNRVFCVSAAERRCVLKEYFQNPSDPRDRFRAEKAFYDYIASHGIGHTPRPLAWDAQRRLGLLEFIDGRKLSAEELDAMSVTAAFEFIIQLNQSKHAERPDREIPVASEACFSLGEHLACVEQRIARLQNITGGGEIDRAAATFVAQELIPRWASVRQELRRASETGHDSALSSHEQCLSPSDFGFHNALLQQEASQASSSIVRPERLKFLDFEYAGWDDPAKLVCDFFCQPELPVPMKHWDLALENMAKLPALPPDFAARCSLLLPAYQLKWCCIMLNDFVRRDQVRREFSLGGEPVEARKERQLQKAQRVLAAWQL